MRSCRRPARTTGSSIAGVESKGLHHVGVAVHDLDEAVETYTRTFGATLEHRDRVAEQGVEAASVLVGASRIELLAPTDEDTPVGRFLARRGPGVHHLAYEVDDVAPVLVALAADGVELIDTVPRIGLFGLQVAFIHPDAVHGVLTEVVALARAI
jgi:methylmalonyl-CoA/ethylmalonyl-CoA epimerase